jgi:hypothetical protein
MCVAQEDCLGIDCHVTIPGNVVRGKLDVSLRVDPDTKAVTITGSSEGQSQDHHVVGDCKIHLCF